MKNRILLLVVLILSLVLSIISSNEKNTTFFITAKEKLREELSSKKQSKDIAVLNTTTNEINKMKLEEYIVGVVAAEMPASFHEEALKAQAIAARTYAVYKMSTSGGNYDIVTDVSNQSFITEEEMHNKWQTNFDKYYNKVKQAVLDTQNLIMTYNGQVIEAYYFAMSNGYTEKASAVFASDRDYLQSVVSAYDNESLKNYEVTKTINKEEFCQKLNIKCDNIVIQDISRCETNRINTITINDTTFKGTTFRSKLSLRSTDFDISINNDNIVITTRGFGHGVGMSQYGANGMAEAGSSYAQILKYFYKNIEIETI